MRFLKAYLFVVLLFVLTAGLTAVAWAQDLYIYPQKGPSKSQIEKDKYACYQWAKEKTGFDPMAASRPSTPPPPGTKSRALRGAAGGAAFGAIGGAIAGDAGKGAAIGAATGGVIGGVRRRRNQRIQEQWAQNQASAQTQRRTEYNRAYGACMQGRGYTVK